MATPTKEEVYMRTSTVLIFCICVFAPAMALSFEPEINYGVDFRLRGNYVSDFEVDDSGFGMPSIKGRGQRA
jgi:hypothetical protein